MASTTVTYTCGNCEKETRVYVAMPTPALRRGHPDNWAPPEGGEHEPDTCECGAIIEFDDVLQLAMEDD